MCVRVSMPGVCCLWYVVRCLIFVVRWCCSLCSVRRALFDTVCRFAPFVVCCLLFDVLRVLLFVYCCVLVVVCSWLFVVCCCVLVVVVWWCLLCVAC